MTQFPEFEGNTQHIKESKKDEHKNSNIINWDEYYTYLKCDESIPPVPWAKAGKEAAMERFQEFCTNKEQGLKQFDTLRNDPNYQNVCSNLSPWINYGMVSFQRLALDVRKLKKYPNGTASYIEEGIVRRELSDNFVYYTKDNYDELTCAAVWAQESLELHSVDEREYLYTFEELEGGKTHDDLWNAAQIQLVSEGQMHGFLRMYWAKKILEWTESPKVALRTGLYFNDRYALDGNDPNGFTGVGWSVMGIHDMGWKERPIFGKIRFMNYAGCKRKFKVDTFVSRYRDARLNAIKVEAKVGKKVDVKKTGKKRKAPSR
jgi:deoxyribodipyrimidine photo-lyase